MEQSTVVIKKNPEPQARVLYKAIDKNNEECVIALLNEGVDINASYEGYWVPLHLAVQRGHAGLVTLLVELVLILS